jgi:hypothetical protein
MVFWEIPSMKIQLHHLTIAMLATAATISTASANPRMGGGVYVPQVNVPRGGNPGAGAAGAAGAAAGATQSAVNAARSGTGAAVFGPTVGGIDNAQRTGPLTTSINTSLVPGSDITEYTRPEPWKSPAQRVVEYVIDKVTGKLVDKALENTIPGAVPVKIVVDTASKLEEVTRTTRDNTAQSQRNHDEAARANQEIINANNEQRGGVFNPDLPD